MQKIKPFIWYDGEAEEAANLYVSVFSNRPGSGEYGPSKITGITRYNDAAPGPTGRVMTVEFLLEGQEFVGLNGGKQQFSLNESISFQVDCESQQEVDHFWNAFTKDGEEGPCGWLKDPFGVSWQIVPRRLTELLTSGDAAVAERVTAAFMKMKKLDVAEIERAAKG